MPGSGGVLSLAELSDAVERLKNGLIFHATGGRMDELVYGQIRKLLLGEPRLEGHLPGFLKTCRTTHEFWGYIKAEFRTYQDRRDYLAQQFNPILDALDEGRVPGGSKTVGLAAEVTSSNPLTQEFITSQLQKCDGKLNVGDYDGAITNARTLVEAVLGEMEVRLTGGEPSTDGDIVKQYKKVQKLLNLDPADDKLETPLRQVLTGLSSIIAGLAGMRNKMGDAHARTYRPEEHHARLAVNSAKTLADFLFETFEYQMKRGSISEPLPRS